MDGAFRTLWVAPRSSSRSLSTMRPMRGGDIFGRGGFFNVRSAAAKLAIAMIAVTVVSLLTRIAPLVALNPESVITAYALWQPFTYAFLETSPFGLIFGAIIVW